LDCSPLNITSFGKALQIRGPTIYRWYRDVLSDYAKDKKVMHKHDVVKATGQTIEVPILEEKNFGDKMCIDEKNIGEDLCTIISNRNTGKVAMICKSIVFSEIKEVFRPYEHVLKKIKSITRDFSSLYEKVCTELMPDALQVGDKFHVIRNLMEAHQAVRIRYRQKELEKRRKALHEFKDSEHERLLECERAGTRFIAGKFHYKEERMANGETMLEVLSRSRYLLFKYPNQWRPAQHKRAMVLFKAYPEIEQTFILSCQFRNLLSQKNIGNHYLQVDKQFHEWYENIENADIEELLNFKSMVESNEDIIRNYFIEGETNATAESINSKIQKFVTSNCGTRDKDFFYFRLANYYA
jgi:transposase